MSYRYINNYIDGDKHPVDDHQAQSGVQNRKMYILPATSMTHDLPFHPINRCQRAVPVVVGWAGQKSASVVSTRPTPLHPTPPYLNKESWKKL